MPGSIRGVAFDKDGTLIDFEKTWLPGILSAAYALDALHDTGPGPEALTRAAGGDPTTRSVAPGSLMAQGTAPEVAALWRSLAPSLPDPEELAAWLDTYWLDHAARNLTPVCDLTALFTALRGRDIKIAIVTNDVEQGAHDMVDALGLGDLVDFVAGYDSGHRPKPAPDMIQAFMRAQGLAPSETLMVGDNRGDVEAGRAAGCRATIGVLTGATPEEHLKEIADFILPHAGLIPTLIAEAL